jgi:hypothetical protein
MDLQRAELIRDDKRRPRAERDAPSEPLSDRYLKCDSLLCIGQLCIAKDMPIRMTAILGWPGVEPGRPFGLQIFAPLWLSPPHFLRLWSGLCLDLMSVISRRPRPSSLYTFPGYRRSLARHRHAAALRQRVYRI